MKLLFIFYCVSGWRRALLSMLVMLMETEAPSEADDYYFLCIVFLVLFCQNLIINND